jgi:TRAP-type C4-dicarboxylate transport system permease small subunit
VMNNTPTWVEQVSLLLVAYITFLGAAIGVRDGSHLSIEFIRDAMPPRPRMVLALVSDAGLVAVGVTMAWQGIKLTLMNTQRAIPMIDMPEAWRYAPLAICGVLMAIFSSVNLLRRLNEAAPAGA